MLHSVWLPRGCITSKHCLPLCASGLGSGGQKRGKMLFSKTILFHSTTPYLSYFLCILLVRFPMREHLSRVSKVYQTGEATFILRKQVPIFKVWSFLGPVLETSWSLCYIFGLISEIQEEEPNLMYVYYQACGLFNMH